MKKIFLLIFISFITLLNANFLIDAYHKDYGVIDRTVLVFDTKPQYDILKHGSSIEVSLEGCRKDASLQNFSVINSKVLTGFEYLISGDGIKVIININTTQLLITGEIYRVNGMELQGDVFKLVLDIFISNNPQSLSELSSYASFYKEIGNEELANEYSDQVVKLHSKIKAQQENTITQVDNSKQKISVFSILLTSAKELISKIDLKILGIVVGMIILIIVIIILIVKLFGRKTSTTDTDIDSLRPKDGFANSVYLKEVAKKLAASKWDVDEIAKELELPVDEVQRFIAPDLAQELEHL